jgi:hypothetical protein
MLPQIIFIVIVAIELLYVSYMHGKLNSEKYNIFTYLLSACITFALLFKGGFFNDMHI